MSLKKIIPQILNAWVVYELSEGFPNDIFLAIKITQETYLKIVMIQDVIMLKPLPTAL